MRILKSFKQTFNGKSKAWIQLSFGPALWVKKRFNQRGFSLVELMVVVAIIGILASIAIPNYQKFRRKAQQSSAKSALSGIFTAERTFTAEWSFGATSFAQIGYQQEGANLYNVGWETGYNSGNWNASGTHANVTNLYKGPKVASGFSDYKTGGGLGGAIALNSNGFKSCANVDTTKTGCSSATCTLQSGSCSHGVTGCAETCPTATNDLIVPGNGTTRTAVDTFTIGAAANIGGGQDDLWTMDQNKNLVNVQSGL